MASTDPIDGAPPAPSNPPALPSDRDFVRAIRDHAISSGGHFGSRALGLTQPPELEQWSRLSRPSITTLLARFEPVLDPQDDTGKQVAADEARRWALHPDAGVVVAVEIGQQDARVAVSDLYGRLAPADQDPLGPESADVTLDWVARNLRRLVGDRAPEDVVGVCISLAAPVDRVKGVLRSPLSTRRTDPADAAFAEWQRMKAREQLTSRLGWDDVTFLLDNDANLSALAEYVWGAGRWAASRPLLQRRPPYENVFYVEWSRGIGGGLILNGELYRGAGIAGEIGHTVVAPEENAECSRCGQRGCLEAVAGWDAVLRGLLPAQEEHRISRKDFLAMLDPEHGRRDDVSMAFKAAARHMARALGPVINLLNPELVVIGGDVGRFAYDLIRAPLLDSLNEFAIHPALADVTVRQTKLAEDGALRGAIALVLLPQQGDPEALLTFLQRKAKAKPVRR